jgi:hypothetical protein
LKMTSLLQMVSYSAKPTTHITDAHSQPSTSQRDYAIMLST